FFDFEPKILDFDFLAIQHLGIENFVFVNFGAVLFCIPRPTASPASIPTSSAASRVRGFLVLPLCCVARSWRSPAFLVVCFAASWLAPSHNGTRNPAAESKKKCVEIPMKNQRVAEIRPTVF